ncbi:MAG: DUF4340 domain-containing protein [Gammaproteobacteria bacterium]|nr:DUF4340 domain-containing protein [Gammaproteobacteria bacterium]
MTRLARANVAMAAAVLLLALIARLEPGREPAPTLAALTDVPAQSVRGVRLFDGNGLVLALERVGAHWELTAPAPGPADGARVERLLGLLGTPSLRNIGRVEGRLAEFGLDPPELIAEFDGIPVAFGGLDPVSRQRYVSYGGEVHLIGDGYRHHLLAGPEGFRAAR